MKKKIFVESRFPCNWCKKRTTNAVEEFWPVPATKAILSNQHKGGVLHANGRLLGWQSQFGLRMQAQSRGITESSISSKSMSSSNSEVGEQI